jgi:hypothetical protein
MAEIGDIVLVREDRHTNRTAHDAHLAAVEAFTSWPARVAAHEDRVDAGEPSKHPGERPPPPTTNPAPMHAWYYPLIVTTVHADGAVSGNLFKGRRGAGDLRKVKPGDADGCYIEKPSANITTTAAPGVEIPSGEPGVLDPVDLEGRTATVEPVKPAKGKP